MDTKYFNTAGPCVEVDHYTLPPLDRCKEIDTLISKKNYFVIHAARQSGKTTLIQSLTNYYNRLGRYYALYCSLETVEIFRTPELGIPIIIENLKNALKYSDLPHKEKFGSDTSGSPALLLRNTLSGYCQILDKPLILFLDEVDCLSDDTLISFLRQLRDGFVNRAHIPFPSSIALVGMRSIRDYKIHVRDSLQTLGSASPFNIISESLSLTDFTLEEVATLYRQHTQATGQIFEEEAIRSAHDYTAGQPWLVNALANECVSKILNKDFSQTVTKDHIQRAVENIIRRRDTHIDSLLERLKEDRVRRVIEPLILGKDTEIDFLSDDAQYCIDLGLVISTKNGFMPSNKIYREVILRTLSYNTQINLQTKIPNRWIENGLVDMSGLLQGFQQFWRENSVMWSERFDYKEAAPHLILQAFLQRIINGGGNILREYASGRGRLDLCVQYENRNYPIELKLYYNNKTQSEGLQQLAEYMDTFGATEGWLVIFDRRKSKSWREKIYWRVKQVEGKVIYVVGC